MRNGTVRESQKHAQIQKQNSYKHSSVKPCGSNQVFQNRGKILNKSQPKIFIL